MWEQTKQRQSARVIQERAAGGDPDKLLVKREDILGPKFLDESACKALQQLEVSTMLEPVPVLTSLALQCLTVPSATMSSTAATMVWQQPHAHWSGLASTLPVWLYACPHPYPSHDSLLRPCAAWPVSRSQSEPCWG
jgi:hypothetical protein